jgi:RHS repeat-associated protein
VIVGRYAYDPYGNTLAVTGSRADVNRYRFSSKEYHTRSGLCYYGYRWYSSQLQRWPNRDPLDDTARTWVDTMNMTATLSKSSRHHVAIAPYKFVANDPLSYVDTFGLAWVAPSRACTDDEDASCRKFCSDRNEQFVGCRCRRLVRQVGPVIITQTPNGNIETTTYRFPEIVVCGCMPYPPPPNSPSGRGRNNPPVLPPMPPPGCRP